MLLSSDYFCGILALVSNKQLADFLPIIFNWLCFEDWDFLGAILVNKTQQNSIWMTFGSGRDDTEKFSTTDFKITMNAWDKEGCLGIIKGEKPGEIIIQKGDFTSTYNLISEFLTDSYELIELELGAGDISEAGLEIITKISGFNEKTGSVRFYFYGGNQGEDYSFLAKGFERLVQENGITFEPVVFANQKEG
jgi:hypothetical protein